MDVPAMENCRGMGDDIMILVLRCDGHPAAIDWGEVPSSQHLYHRLLWVGIGDSGQAEDEIVYAPAMVDQHRYAAQCNPSGIAHEEHIRSEVFLHLGRESGLGFRLAHYVVIARGDDDLDVASYGI